MPKAAFLLSRSMEVRLTTLLGNYDWLTVIDKPSVRPTKQPTERQTDRPIGAWKSYFQTFKKIVTDRRTNRIEYSKSRYIPLPALLTQAEAETCFRYIVFFFIYAAKPSKGHTWDSWQGLSSGLVYSWSTDLRQMTRVTQPGTADVQDIVISPQKSSFNKPASFLVVAHYICY